MLYLCVNSEASKSSDASNLDAVSIETLKVDKKLVLSCKRTGVHGC